MKIYVSAVTDAKAKAARFVARVREIGGTITRDWSSTTAVEIGSPEHERASAEETRAAILAADFFVAFLSKNRNGTGLHTEIGMALAYQKRVLIVGRSLPRRGVLMLADRGLPSAILALEELHAWMRGNPVPNEIRERWVAEDVARHALQAEEDIARQRAKAAKQKEHLERQAAEQAQKKAVDMRTAEERATAAESRQEQPLPEPLTEIRRERRQVGRHIVAEPVVEVLHRRRPS